MQTKGQSDKLDTDPRIARIAREDDLALSLDPSLVDLNLFKHDDYRLFMPELRRRYWGFDSDIEEIFSYDAMSALLFLRLKVTELEFRWEKGGHRRPEVDRYITRKINEKEK